MRCINIHLSPGCIGNAPYAGHLSCALSEERESLEKEVAGCGRPCPWSSYQLNPNLAGGLRTPVGAPPPASGSSDAPGPRRAAETEAETVRWFGGSSKFRAWDGEGEKTDKKKARQ